MFTDERFADLFPARGRPALSPAALAMVSVLQFTEGLSDRQAAHAVRARIDWKYALGLGPTDPGFDHSVLSEFRDRIIAGKAEARITDAVPEAAARAGLLKTARQRTDSTHVVAANRDMARLEMIGETLRATLNVLAAAPEWLSADLDEAWFKRYSHRIEDARLPKRAAERVEARHQVGENGMRLLRSVLDPAAPAWLRQVPAVETLRRFWVQEFQVDEDGRVRWRHPDDVPPAARRLVSPYDPRGPDRTPGWAPAQSAPHRPHLRPDLGLACLPQAQSCARLGRGCRDARPGALHGPAYCAADVGGPAAQSCVEGSRTALRRRLHSPAGRAGSGYDPPRCTQRIWSSPVSGSRRAIRPGPWELTWSSLSARPQVLSPPS